MERRKLIKTLSSGVIGSIVGAKFSKAYGRNYTFNGIPEEEKSQIDDWHLELTKRIAGMEENGGGTLELGDGVYEISKPLQLPLSVSLIMTPNAVIRAKPNFIGDAVIIKGGGKKSNFSDTSGWIKGGIIDGGKLPITGIRAEGSMRLEIADLVVWNALYKGIHLLEGGYEKNLTRVRCDVDMNTKYAPGSIGIHYENGDSKVHLAHVIGYETGVRSDVYSNWFSMVHVWNADANHGPMLYNFYCNGLCDTFINCYADSPTEAGFFVTKPHQSFMQNRVFYSRWAEDNNGVGFKITSEGKHGNYFGNVLFANEEHRLAKAFDGDLEGSTILGTSFHRGVMGGAVNRISSGETIDPNQMNGDFTHPPLTFGGTGFCLTEQTQAPLPGQGELGEVRWVDDGKNSALWLKTRKGWKKSKLS